MPAKNRDYKLTAELLREYRDASLSNSQILLDEAELLLAHRHFARAYFLAVSSVEEAGKAVQAYEGLGKNLQDPAVTQRLKLQFEDHSQKITSAFSPWLQATQEIREQFMDFIKLMVDIQFGREASMYTDIHAEKAIVTTPQKQIREKAASDCVRLAKRVLHYARPYAEQAVLPATSRIQDSFFALKPTVFQKMAGTADFWWYYIARMEQGNLALESAAVEYNANYLSKRKTFRSEGSTD
ncbi:AbiV family abortive infection protein [Pseudacidovorax sp. RU35E]|uniref:AbiV family abortive infection protein n=1 Tax=Pseudacidovorax sp. RU35E TaxID=1907403 RepID=UPI000955195B|nr:AbiV family abortive infection protein [Pseudacidovorax sp. RU35E]SIR72671.1 abortive infection protein, AbiV family [Pseudacidovorax sp. RU35E]